MEDAKFKKRFLEKIHIGVDIAENEQILISIFPRPRKFKFKYRESRKRVLISKPANQGRSPRPSRVGGGSARPNTSRRRR